MSVARTARRVRKQMRNNNSHLSGRGVSRYSMRHQDVANQFKKQKK